MILQIAWRNIWRNKLRSSIVIIAITLGLVGGIVANAFMNGMAVQRVKNTIQNEISDIQIHYSQYLENYEAHFVIPMPQKIINQLSQQEGVKGISPRFNISGMASTTTSGEGVNIMGVIPEKEKQTTDIYLKLDSASKFLEIKRGKPIVIGAKLAEKLKVRLRKKIKLTFQDKEGNLVAGSFRIVGIYKTSNTMFDERNVFVKKSDLTAISGYGKEQVNEIAVRLQNHDKASQMANELSKAYSELKIQAWKQISPDLAMMNDFMNEMMYIFLIIILMALGFGIVNTMLMVVLERIKELGMLMAIGMNKWRVFSMIMYETVILSLIGGILGMLSSSVILHFWADKGLNLSMVAKGLESIGYSAVIYPQISGNFYVVLTGLVILTGILASIYPARKAVKLNPADAIRTE